MSIGEGKSLTDWPLERLNGRLDRQYTWFSPEIMQRVELKELRAIPLLGKRITNDAPASARPTLHQCALQPTVHERRTAYTGNHPFPFQSKLEVACFGMVCGLTRCPNGNLKPEQSMGRTERDDTREQNITWFLGGGRIGRRRTPWVLF
jgi:hypothetical protein